MTTDIKRTAERIPLEVLNDSKFGLLDQLLSPDFVDRSPQPGVPPTREGLKQSAIALKTAFPDLHYVVEDAIRMRRPDRSSPDRQRHYEGRLHWHFRNGQARDLD
jgi:SnoaL-like polyketide cyclase